MVLASYLKPKLLDEPERARVAREKRIAEQDDGIARLKQENARLRRENGESVNPDSDNQNQD